MKGRPGGPVQQSVEPHSAAFDDGMRAHEGMAGPGLELPTTRDPDQQLLGCVCLRLSLSSLASWSSSSPSSNESIQGKRERGKQAKNPQFLLDRSTADGTNPIQELSAGIGFTRTRPLPLAAA
jgi:hypothetical protein